jgi:hypothetical protein
MDFIMTPNFDGEIESGAQYPREGAIRENAVARKAFTPEEERRV